MEKLDCGIGCPYMWRVRQKPHNMEQSGKTGCLCYRPHPALETAHHVTINVDAVIFDDGLVIGPDKTGLVDSINARAEAIARISQTVRSAMKDGKDVTATLQAMVPPRSPFETDKVTNWMQFYVGQLLHPPVHAPAGRDRDWILMEMESLPNPPMFIRK